MSTSENWDINRHTAQYIGPVSVVSQCKNWCLAEGQKNGDQSRPMGLRGREGLDVYFYVFFTIPLLMMMRREELLGYHNHNMKYSDMVKFSLTYQF